MMRVWGIAGAIAACGHAGVIGALCSVREKAEAVERRGVVELVMVEEAAPVASERDEAAVVATVGDVVSVNAAASVARVDWARAEAAREEWRSRLERAGPSLRVEVVAPDVSAIGNGLRAGLGNGARAMEVARGWSERIGLEGTRVRGELAARAVHARGNENGAGGGAGRGDGERAGAGAGEAKNSARKGGAIGGGVARGPTVVERGTMGYPEAAARRRVEGTVVVGVRVTGEGAVARVWVSATSGSAELDEAGMATVRAWRFSPAIGDDGRAMASEAQVPVVFRLRRGG